MTTELDAATAALDRAAHLLAYAVATDPAIVAIMPEYMTRYLTRFLKSHGTVGVDCDDDSAHLLGYAVGQDPTIVAIMPLHIRRYAQAMLDARKAVHAASDAEIFGNKS